LTETLPDPLVALDVDIAGLDSFMLDIQRLFASELWALSTGDEFKAAISLWGRAWQQTPPGSLPNDDRALAAFSGAGTHWKKVKAMAMRGFIECSDGRLYHRVLCKEVVKAAQRRQDFKRRTKNATDARRNRNVAGNTGRNDERDDVRDVDRNDSEGTNVTTNVTSLKGRRSDVEGKEGKSSVSEDGNGGSLPKPPDPDADLFNRGKAILGKNAGGQIAKLKAMFGGDVARTRAYLEDAAVKNDPGEWVAATIRKHAGKPPPAAGGLDFQRFPANGLYDTSI
jgi:hypothetical protein